MILLAAIIAAGIIWLGYEIKNAPIIDEYYEDMYSDNEIDL